MLALDTGGMSVGVAFRLPPESVAEEMALLWRREMGVGSYAAKWLCAKTAEGDIRVLAFVANKQASNYVCGALRCRKRPSDRERFGLSGSNLEYLVRTNAGLSEHGIRRPCGASRALLCRSDSSAGGRTVHPIRNMRP
jgi:cation transport protein ChaC